MTGSRPTVGERLYGAILTLYPRRFRQRHGEEMRRLHRKKAQDARARGGWLAVFVHWCQADVDALRNAIAAHFDEMRMGGGMDSLFRDVRYAARALRKSPGFALVATLTIALGIGANTAIFSVVRTVLLQPLPYEEPEELVILWGELQNRGITHFPMSPPDFRDYREQIDGLDDVGAVFTFSTSLTGDGEPVQVDMGAVTPNFLSVLGVEPVIGRGFIEEDGVPDQSGVQPGQPGALPGIVILSHSLWQQRYGGDPGVLGTTVEIGGAPSEIVGVMPPDFELLMPATAAVVSEPDLWVSLRLDYANAPRNNVFLIPVGRLGDGVTREQVQSQADRIAASLRAENQVRETAGYAVRIDELAPEVTAHVRPVLMALFGAVVFVLLIACANVANLLLVRASGRDRELAVRAALGGSRGRLIRQMLIESGLLAFAGAAVGLLLAAGGISLLLALRPAELPRIDNVGIDGAVLLFTVLAACGAAFLFGILPALQSSQVDLADALKERGAAGAGMARRLVRNGVVIVEVALSLVLLIGAGLMARSFVELSQVSPGYEPGGLLTFNAAPPPARYPEVEDRVRYNLELQRRLEGLPGVQRAANAFPLPLSGTPFNGRYGPEEALTDPEAFGQAAYRVVLPGYFETMGTRLLAGRTFSEADNQDSAAVVVIDEILAEELWPGSSPVGERFLIRAVTPDPQWVEVIGVVEHQRADDLAAEGLETVYFTDKYVGSFGGTWAVRAEGDPLDLSAAIRAEVAEMDPDIPVADLRLMESRVAEAMAPTRFALTLIGIFGLIALVLASVGLYGVLSFVVRQRTAEIGVRMAFGAGADTILKLVVGQGLALAGAGVGVGLLAAFAVTGVMESLLVGVSPTDPVTFAAISGLFIAIAVLACVVPARRATRVDPVTALREE